MPDAALVAKIKKEFDALPKSDEQARRDWAVQRATDLGRSGKIAVHEATGIALTTLRRGIKNLQSGNTLSEGRRRRPGAGRRAAVEHDPVLLKTLYQLLEPRGPGNHEALLRWTARSTRRLASELTKKKHHVGATTVLQLLKREGFHVEANRRSRPGQASSDRHAQFQRILRHLESQRQSGEPALAVELRVGQPAYSDKSSGAVKGKLPEQDAWELVGIGRETVALTVLAIYDWWNRIGAARNPKAGGLLVITDSRVAGCDRAWKNTLQRLADVLQRVIHVKLLPAATYKLAALECQLVARLQGTARGRPSITHEVTVSLVGPGIGQSHTQAVETEIEAMQLELLSSRFMNERFAVNLRSSPSGGAWNYAILPWPAKQKQSDYFRSITNARK